MTTLFHLLIKIQIISNVTNPIRSGNPNRTNKLVMETTMQGFYETNAVFYTFVYFYNLLHCSKMLTNMIRKLDCRVQSNCVFRRYGSEYPDKIQEDSI